MAVMRGINVIGSKIGGFLALGFLLAACVEPTTVSKGPKVDASKPVLVALMVPSGSGVSQQDALASSLVSAAKMAVAEMSDVKIDLRVYSTAANATTAASAAQRAADDGAKIIVGPLFAAAANAAGTTVASKGINVLSFSNNPDIAGGNVFILGDTFQNTANRVIGYASGKGQRSVAALVRADAAGDVAIAAVQKAATKAGSTYVGAARYHLTTESVVSAVGAAKSLIASTGASALIMDADSAGALPVFAELLPENGITSAKTQFLGLTRWDKTSEQVRTNAGLQGSLFALTDTSATSAFNERYKAANGSNPHLLAGKAYDAIQAVGTLLRSGSKDALTRTKLTRSAGFKGANGVFRLMSDGTNERALGVATFRDGQVVLIDPAPRGFGGAGF